MADIVSNMNICSILSLCVIFCEAVAIYGIIVAIILQTKLESVPAANIYDPESLRAGYAIFASGLIVGFANLGGPFPCCCDIQFFPSLAGCVIGSSCALSDAQNSSLFVKILVIEIFGSAWAIWSDCWNYYVSTSNMANQSLVSTVSECGVRMQLR
ncbi:hypothetical protein V8G54_028183 [Vigna mungo]|uniref:V-ATPase proteolipid subunit C-like domain-containing protein n=1 Tax=Vigna mungo TaxID=3915 RepID=A0AAQ3MRI9_VIGMU